MPLIQVLQRRQSELTEKELEETTELETREGILEIFTRKGILVAM